MDEIARIELHGNPDVGYSAVVSKDVAWQVDACIRGSRRTCRISPVAGTDGLRVSFERMHPVEIRQTVTDGDFCLDYASDLILPEARYSGAVAKLFEIGADEEIDYQGLGVTRRHVPDLVRLVKDAWFAGVCDEDLFFGPIHAVQVLIRMGVTEALPDLLAFFDRSDDGADDWTMDQYPKVLAKIGEMLIEPCRVFMADKQRSMQARGLAGDTLAVLAVDTPNVRGRCVDVIVG